MFGDKPTDDGVRPTGAGRPEAELAQGVLGVLGEGV